MLALPQQWQARVERRNPNQLNSIETLGIPSQVEFGNETEDVLQIFGNEVDEFNLTALHECDVAGEPALEFYDTG
eukprot:4150598-Amphidinium_carterae.1